MTDDHHVSEDLADLFDCVLSSFMLEQWNEDIFKPVGVESVLFLIDIEDGNDTGVLELSESSFHEFDEFLSHFLTEDFIGSLVIC